MTTSQGGGDEEDQDDHDHHPLPSMTTSEPKPILFSLLLFAHSVTYSVVLERQGHTREKNSKCSPSYIEHYCTSTHYAKSFPPSSSSQESEHEHS